jgi:hypothetical protein
MIYVSTHAYSHGPFSPTHMHAYAHTRTHASTGAYVRARTHMHAHVCTPAYAHVQNRTECTRSRVIKERAFERESEREREGEEEGGERARESKRGRIERTEEGEENGGRDRKGGSEAGSASE